MSQIRTIDTLQWTEVSPKVRNPNTKTYKLLRDSERGRNSLPQGRTYRLIKQYQTVSTENTHTANIQTKQIVFRNTNIFVTTISKQREHEFERDQGRGYGRILKEKR